MAPIRLLGSVTYNKQDHGWALDIGIYLAQWIYISSLYNTPDCTPPGDTIEKGRARAKAINDLLGMRGLAVRLPTPVEGIAPWDGHYEPVFQHINFLTPRHYGIFAAVGAAAAFLNIGKNPGILSEESRIVMRDGLRQSARNRIQSLPGIDRERFAGGFRPEEVMGILDALLATNDIGEALREMLYELSRPMVILFVFADPPDQPRLSLAEEQRLVQDSLVRSNERESFEVRVMPNARPEDLGPQLRRWRPTFVHFSGHGSADRLVFASPAGSAQQIQPPALSRLLQLAGRDRLRGVVMNACYSAEQLQALEQDARLPCPAVVMEAEVADTAAISFSQQFYSYLGDGETFHNAFEWTVASANLTGNNSSMVARLVG
jgi:hypothetical protein